MVNKNGAFDKRAPFLGMPEAAKGDERDGLLPADWWLQSIVSNASRTKILRLRLRMTMSGGKAGT